jgi:hypothetical protein
VIILLISIECYGHDANLDVYSSKLNRTHNIKSQNWEYKFIPLVCIFQIPLAQYSDGNVLDDHWQGLCSGLRLTNTRRYRFDRWKLQEALKNHFAICQPVSMGLESRWTFYCDEQRLHATCMGCSKNNELSAVCLTSPSSLFTTITCAWKIQNGHSQWVEFVLQSLTGTCLLCTVYS